MVLKEVKGGCEDCFCNLCGLLTCEGDCGVLPFKKELGEEWFEQYIDEETNEIMIYRNKDLKPINKKLRAFHKYPKENKNFSVIYEDRRCIGWVYIDDYEEGKGKGVFYGEYGRLILGTGGLPCDEEEDY